MNIRRLDSLSGIEIDVEAVQTVPYELAKKHSILPVEFAAGSNGARNLIVAVPTGTMLSQLTELEAAAERHVSIGYVVPRQDIDNAIEQHYSE